MFQFCKWYFDCVTDAGDAIVVYRASVDWGPLRLDYGASLYRPARGETVQRHTLRPGRQTPVNGDVIQWACPRLDLCGTWSPRRPGFERALLDEPGRLINWHCVSPSTVAEVRIGDVRLQGSGYVEYLGMTVKPWQLPFTELRWGRFLGQTQSLIWIQWNGAVTRTWLWLNGTEIPGEVQEARIDLLHQGGTLDLQNIAVIRSGPLNRTTRHPVRALTGLLPRWRAACETKWLARGTFGDGDQADSGWAIHEVVRWR